MIRTKIKYLTQDKAALQAPEIAKLVQLSTEYSFGPQMFKQIKGYTFILIPYANTKPPSFDCTKYFWKAKFGFVHLIMYNFSCLQCQQIPNCLIIVNIYNFKKTNPPHMFSSLSFNLLQLYFTYFDIFLTLLYLSLSSLYNFVNYCPFLQKKKSI